MATMQLMLPLGFTTIIYFAVQFAISAAISYGVGYLLARLNKPRPPAAPDSQPTLSTRGSYLTLLLGRRRVAPIVCWLGGRELKNHSDKQYYKEKGFHAICLGPVDSLYGIFVGGKLVTKRIGKIERTTSPSGSQFTIDNVGTFRIYWGEDDQPIDDMFYEQTGCGSQWPGVCFIIWDNAAVGPGWQWNQYEYWVERRITTEASLTDSSAWVDRSTRPFRGSVEDSGINPAHAIWYMLTRPYPYGLGCPAGFLDGGSFEALGVLAESEHLPINILGRDGVQGQQVMTELMQEVGFFITQIGPKLVVIPIRPPSGTVPIVTVDAQIDPQPEVKRQHGDTVPTRNVYLIYDENVGYKTNDVSIDNDAQARQRIGTQLKSVQLQNVTDKITGLEIAQRLTNDDSVDGESYTLNLMRGARDLWPGMLFTIPNFGMLRVATRQPQYMSTAVAIEAVFEQYGFKINDWYPDDIGDPNNTDDLPLAYDPFVRLFVLPDALNPYDGPSIWVLRVRANSGVVSAEVFMSGDGIAYSYANRDEPHVAGGVINRPILADEPTHLGGILVADISFTPYNTDADEVDDLAGDVDEYNAGDQIAVVGNEIFLVERLAPQAGGWRIDGFKRAQYGTSAVDHGPGTPIFIFRISARVIYTRHLIQPGATVHVKTLPYNSRDEMILSEVPDNTVTLP